MPKKYLEALKESYLNKRYQNFGFTEKIDKKHFLPLKFSGLDVDMKMV